MKDACTSFRLDACSFFLYFDDPVVITKYCLCITKMTAFVMKNLENVQKLLLSYHIILRQDLYFVYIFTSVYNLSLIIFFLYVLRKLPHRMQHLKIFGVNDILYRQ